MDKALENLCVQWNKETEERIRKESQEEKRQLFADMIRDNVPDEKIRQWLRLTPEQFEKYRSIVAV